MKTLGGAAGEVLRSPKTRLFGSFCLPLPATSTLEPLLEPLFIQSQKKNSRKFAVTSGRRFRLQGCRSLRTLSLPARIEGKFVGFVARDCYEQWQLATLQVPENFSKERHIP